MYLHILITADCNVEQNLILISFSSFDQICSTSRPTPAVMLTVPEMANWKSFLGFELNSRLMMMYALYSSSTKAALINTAFG